MVVTPCGPYIIIMKNAATCFLLLVGAYMSAARRLFITLNMCSFFFLSIVNQEKVHKKCHHTKTFSNNYKALKHSWNFNYVHKIIRKVVTGIIRPLLHIKTPVQSYKRKEGEKKGKIDRA